MRIDYKINRKNKSNQDDYSWKTDPNYLRQHTIDEIYDMINNTNWNQLSDYFNSYHGKPNGNTIMTDGYPDACDKAMEKRRNEPEGCIDPNTKELTAIGKKYYAKEIAMTKKLLNEI